MNRISVPNISLRGISLKGFSFSDTDAPSEPPVVFYDYIIGDGEAYIDTGIIPNAKTIVPSKISFKINTIDSKAWSRIIGTKAELPYYIARSFKNNYQINWGTYNNDAYSAIPITANVDSIIDIDIANKTFKKDGVSYDASSYIGSDKATTPLLIWSKNNKLHYLQIDDEVSGLKYHLLPCTYMGEPGMYDTVNNVFYGNANTEGSFTVAND